MNADNEYLTKTMANLIITTFNCNALELNMMVQWPPLAVPVQLLQWICPILVQAQSNFKKSCDCLRCLDSR